MNAICLLCVIFCPFKLLLIIHVNNSPKPQGINLLGGGVFLSFYTTLVQLLSISGIASDTHKRRLQRARFSIGIMRSLGLNLMKGWKLRTERLENNLSIFHSLFALSHTVDRHTTCHTAANSTGEHPLRLGKSLSSHWLQSQAKKIPLIIPLTNWLSFILRLIFLLVTGNINRQRM